MYEEIGSIDCIKHGFMAIKTYTNEWYINARFVLGRSRKL